MRLRVGLMMMHSLAVDSLVERSWIVSLELRRVSLDSGRGGGGAACGVCLPIHVDEVRPSGVHSEVQQSEHPGSDVGVHPVLVLLILPAHEPDQDRDKCREVEESGTGSEPKFHHQPVDSEFVEGLSETEVVEAEEDGAEEADDDHCEEPVLTVHIGGGGGAGGVTASLTSLLW